MDAAVLCSSVPSKRLGTLPLQMFNMLAFSAGLPVSSTRALGRYAIQGRTASSRPRRPRHVTVASAHTRRAQNVDGQFFVDSSCIDCDTCRWLTPEVFSRKAGQSAVHAQPTDETSTRRALAAAVACPTGSIRTETPMREAKEAQSMFPLAMNDERTVFYAGYSNKEAFGSSSWLLVTPDVNILFDIPRYNSGLAKRMEALFAERGRPGSTLDYIVLSHKDDVAWHDAWAKRFPTAKRVIHDVEVRRSQGTDACEIKLSLGKNGEGDRMQLAPGVDIIHVPGHSMGSIAMLDHKSASLFTGDHLAFSSRIGDLSIFPRYGYDIRLQRENVLKLAEEPFLHMYPGHGRMYHFANKAERRERLEMLALAEAAR